MNSASVDLIAHQQIRIERRPSDIWPLIVDTNGWKMGLKLVPNDGEPRRPGERFDAVMPDNPQQVVCVVENVEIVQNQRRTIRLTALDGALIGFATWQLATNGDCTLVEYDVYCQVDLSIGREGPLPKDLEEAKREYLDNTCRRFADELVMLKKIAEEMCEHQRP